VSVLYAPDDPYNVRTLARIEARVTKGAHWHFPGSTVTYRGTPVSVRRVVWALNTGAPVPADQNVIPACEQPDCVLFPHLTTVPKR
jgi:hypothetical protein